MYKTKQDYNINKAKSFFLGILITVGTGLAMIFGTGCHHEDPVTPPNPKPDPTDTIIIPTKEKTFNWDWTVDTTWTPSFDSLKKYVDDPTYKYIFMNMVNKNNQYEGVEGSPCNVCRARDFRRARDSVYSIADKCNGKLLMSGIINVDPINGAQLHDTVAPNTRGMWKRDSIDLSALGVHIKRLSH